MLLTVASLLTALGFAGWIAGTVFEYHGVAFAGAAIIIVTGGWIMATDGLQVEAGTVETNVSANETRTETVHEPARSPFDDATVGMLVMLFGGITSLKSVEKLS